jgi:hypothetical protein
MTHILLLTVLAAATAADALRAQRVADVDSSVVPMTSWGELDLQGTYHVAEPHSGLLPCRPPWMRLLVVPIDAPTMTIAQTPGWVVIRRGTSPARAVPVDKLRHVRTELRRYLGDPYGRWEARSLVIESRARARELWTALTGRDDGADVTHTERLVRLDRETLGYELEINESTGSKRRWAMAIALKNGPSAGDDRQAPIECSSSSR